MTNETNDSTDSTGSRRFDLDRRNYLAATGGALAATLGQASGTSLLGGGPGSGSRPAARDVLVGVERAEPDIAETVAQHLPAGAEVVHRNDSLSYVGVSFPDEATDVAREQFVEAVTERAGIRYAEENAAVRAAHTPNDPRYGDQSALETVDAPGAWSATTGDGDVTVAVLDTGVEYGHADLSAGFGSNPGYDFVDDDSDPAPDAPADEYHGTHVAGTIAAATDNGTGVAGLSGATLLAGRVLDESGYGTVSGVADGIQWAADQGADVINLSLAAGFSSAMQDAVEYAHDRDALLVASAGNNSTDVGDYYPASYPECVAVAGLNQDGTLYAESNRGDGVELCAPAESVLSTTTGTRGEYERLSGTSHAAAVVSGVAALARSQWDLSNDQLREHLKRQAVDVGLAAGEQGSGRVSAERAVTTSPTRVVEDFSDGVVTDAYSFDRGASGASVVSSPTYSGSNALAVSGTNTEMISTSGLGTYPSAGDTLRFRLRGTGGATNVNLTYGVQDHQNRYFVRFDFNDDNLQLFRYENGNSNRLAITSGGFDIREDEWYEVEVDWGADGTHAVTAYDAVGRQIAELSATDATWTSGGVGYDAYAASGETIYFDAIEVDVDDRRADGFEDGDLSEWEFQTGSSAASVVSSPTYSGSRALEVADDGAELVSTSGLPTYPTVGDVVRYRVRNASGTANVDLSYGLQDHRNRYFVRVDFVDDRLRLFRLQEGETTLLDRQDSGFTASAGEWYEVAIEWGSNGGHRVTLSDESGTTVAELQIADRTWFVGGLGVDAYPSSGDAVQVDAIEVDAGDASDAGIVEGFESGDLGAYSRHSNPDATSVVAGPAADGYQALEISGDSTEMYSTSGLPAYPEAGDTVYYRLLATGQADDLHCVYGDQGDESAYVIQVDFKHDNIQLHRSDAGSWTALRTMNSGMTANYGEWYELEVDWGTDGSHDITLRDDSERAVASISATDSTYTAGGVGYEAFLSGDAGSAFFDRVEVLKAGDSSRTLIDGFEDGDLSEYSFHQGSAGASVNDTFVLDGVRMLELDGTTTGAHSTEGLRAYPEQGDTFSYHVFPEGGATDVSLDYGVQAAGSEYRVKADLGNDELHLAVAESGTETVLASQTSGFTVSQGSWNEIEVEWGVDGSHTATIYDPAGSVLAQVSATDHTYERGGVGYDADLASGSAAYVDSVTLK